MSQDKGYIFSKITVTRDVTAPSFQSMAKVCVAECNCKLKISYVKERRHELE